jgi:RimJ/RimL family protein N-acetyltransferase
VAARPFENAFLHWILDGGHGVYAPDEVVLERRADGDVRGVIYYGSQLVVAGDDPAALDAFARETRKYPGLRSFVGPKHAVDALWERLQAWYRAPSLVRERQPLYVLAAEGLAEIEDAEVRRARVDEAPLIADHSAQMILGELGYDPRRQRTTFTAGVRRAIELGLWWVWIVDGEVRFQCNVGAQTPLTAQLQGVWTPPALRGRGYATRGLAAISRRLLADFPTTSLYVNDFNHDAIAVYQRVGFERVGELTTYLFS